MCSRHVQRAGVLVMLCAACLQSAALACSAVGPPRHSKAFGQALILYPGANLLSQTRRKLKRAFGNGSLDLSLLAEAVRIVHLDPQQADAGVATSTKVGDVFKQKCGLPPGVPLKPTTKLICFCRGGVVLATEKAESQALAGQARGT